MKLIQLELENFRQFERAVIDFGDGMTAIVGANGAGKTTILEAISFALFAKQRDTQDTLRWHWAQKGKYSVILRFQLGEKIYEVMRGETKAHLKLITKGGDQVWASSKEQVERGCINLLGMTYLRFKNSFCAEQKDLKFLNFERRTDVQQEIIRMLGYDRLKDAEDLARKNAKTARDTATGIRAALGDKAELERRVQEAVLKLLENERLLKKTQADQSLLQEKLSPVRVSRESAEKFKKLGREMGEIRGRKDALLNAVKIADSRVMEADAEVKLLEAAQPSEDAYRQVTTELLALDSLREKQHRRETLLRDETRLLEEIEDLKSRRLALEAPDMPALLAAKAAAEEASALAQVQLSQLQSKWEKDRREAEAAASSATTFAKEIARQLERAEAMLAKGICPECGQPLSETVSRGVEERRKAKLDADQKMNFANQAAAKLQSIPEAVSLAQKALEGTKVHAEEAARILQKGALLDQQCQSLGKDIAGRETSLLTLRKELSDTPSVYNPEVHESTRRRQEELRPLHEQFMRLQDAPARLKSAHQQSALAKAELDAAVARFKDLKAEQTSLGIPSEEAADAAIAALHQLELEMKALSERLLGAENLQRSFESEKKRAEELLAKQAEDRLRLVEQEEADALFDQVGKQMRILRDLISTQIVPDLVGRASENLALLTNGRYLRLELDEKTFQASLVDGDTRKRVISGGEEDVVALCLRLALSELIQERQGHPMSLLILDEVFGSLDPERRQSVLDRLVALRPRFQQILVISHIEEINQVADRCLYVRHDPVTHSSSVSDVPPQGSLILDF